MDALMIIIFVLLTIAVFLVVLAVAQIKMAGMKVKDFWSFIQANEMLDKLYRVSRKYENMGPQEQILFLMEAEKVFKAFDKVPDMLWEDEYTKYMEVLEKYRNIKVYRWESN